MTTTSPMLSLDAARALESSFKGRILSPSTPGTRGPGGGGDRGAPTVFVPASAADVGVALRLARMANRRVSVQADQGVSSAEVSPGDLTIVSMEAFQRIDVRAGRVTVGAAATTGDVAAVLARKGHFLPLDDNPDQSIASAVAGMKGSPFLRSGGGLGSLRDAVIAAEVVPTDGTGAGAPKTLRGDAVRELWSGGDRAIITKLVFDTTAWTKDAERRWTQAWMTTYEPKSFALLCSALFGKSGGAIPAHVDLTVRAISAAFSMTLVLVRATGHGDAERKATLAVIKAACAHAGCSILSTERATGPGASVSAWVATGAGSASGQDEIERRFGSNTVPRSFGSFKADFLDAVEFALGVDAATGREHAPAMEAWAELQLAASGKVVARAQLMDATVKPSVAKEARARMQKAIPADGTATVSALARDAVIRRDPARPALHNVAVMSSLTPTLDFVLSLTRPIGDGTIPGFKGDVLAKGEHLPRYDDAVQQYAVTSYPPAIVQARMRPQFLVVPRDADDVATAVQFAADNGLKVVARSGGHQYCGLSSGGDGTLVVDLKLLFGATFSPATGTPTQVTVRPGTKLRDLSAALRDKQVTVPHGECPLVNIGGHVQTGGIGHTLRSLGAALDFVSSFKMVTRDPLSMGVGVFAELAYSRPTAANPGEPTDDDVFRAVLGGGPGSFGVLTEVTFDLVPDEEHRGTHGYTRTYPYKKSGFRAAMEQLRSWAERASKDELPEGVDLFLTVVSGEELLTPGVLGRPAALVVETMCLDAKGVPEIRAVVAAVEKALPLDAILAANIVGGVTRAAHGKVALSAIAHEGVRTIGVGGMPESGREFDLPYKKSLYITKTPFTPKFRDGFVDLVDRVNAADAMKVVFQAVVGGGAFRDKGKATTHMQRRDGLVQLVFDVFYGQGQKAKAEKFQAEMKALLTELSGGEDLRMFWGTFEDQGANGAQLDMRDPAVQGLYYDSPGEYARLQQIKQYIDPEDVFHTSFTVKPPP